VTRSARYDDWRAARYFPGLDGLRTVAALLVVFDHARTHRLRGVL
jgi:peptidoglycan/LPS O-acetylase OafA/YrhL